MLVCCCRNSMPFAADRLAAFKERATLKSGFPEVPLRGAFIDEQISPCARSALAKFLRVTEHQIKALELRRQFPILPMEWILRSIDWELGSPARFVQGRAMYAFCPICIQEMSRRTRAVWIRSEWAFVFQTHCARHRTPLVETCGICFIEDPLAIRNPPNAGPENNQAAPDGAAASAVADENRTGGFAT